jgi:haloacetate dehalogenase
VYDGYQTRRISTKDALIYTTVGGSGPPLLLLHGYPQTHVMWHRVAPRLQERFTLVLPDLRGYGESTGPAPDPQHVNYSKRAMASDMVAVMAALGHKRFSVAGHDGGGRVAYRLALDRPECVERLAVLDILPTLDAWEGINDRTAMASFHWLLLAQPPRLPERLIGCDPQFFLRYILERWAGRAELIDPHAAAEYLQNFRKPSVIAAACEDYRASATVDVELDRRDREAGRRITCPTLVLWSKRYLNPPRPPREVWAGWADDVRDVALECGHFIAEEDPAGCAAALADFFGARPDPH